MKLGIELEFWVVDEDGRLCDADELIDAHERVEPEFIDPLLEVQTAPHDTERGVRRSLERTFEDVLENADAADKRLVPLGTPLTTASPPATGDRGRLFERIYGDGVESAKNCAGTHVHFEQDAVCRQLNLLTALDPAIALVNSSPYYCGERGDNSARAAAYRGECGEAFERFCGLWPYVDDVAEWKDRVAAAYDRFRELAADRDVDPATVDAAFAPEDTVLNPVRLREEFPTVEWRAPDTALPSQVVRLAFDVRGLLAQTSRKPVEIVSSVAESGVGEDAIRVPEFETLRTLSDEAIRLGVGSERVRSYLRRMGFDVTSYRPIAAQFDGPGTLRESEARDLRLAYARRLCVDVASLTGPADWDRVDAGDGLFARIPN